MTTTVTITYDCGATYKIPTTIPATGSALHHATTVDTVTALVDAQHAADHPDCPNGDDE